MREKKPKKKSQKLPKNVKMRQEVAKKRQKFRE